MTQADRPHSHPTLEDYLDGILDRTDREAFEFRVQADPALRRAVEQQQQIDAALSRLFTAPSAETLSRKVTDGVTARRGGKGVAGADAGRRRFLALAACIGIGAVATWRLWSFFQPAGRDIYAAQEWRSLQTVYDDVLAAGFKPDWVCKDDEELVSSFRKRLRARLIVAQTPSVAAGGLGYCNCITPSTMFVLARVAPEGTLAKPDPQNAAKVIVFVDRASRDTDQTLPDDSPLKLFKKQLGPFVLYEVTPLSKPFVLDLFRQPL
jgi:hypothetical protein